MHDPSKCRFCKLANGEIKAFIVYEDNCVCCFLSKKPISEGHVLIVTKKPYFDVDEIDIKTAEHVMKAAILLSKALKRRYHPDGISIVQNGGIFNDVKHYHMHVFCRNRSDGFGWKFTDADNDKFYCSGVQSTIKEAVLEVLHNDAS